jgi:hypothetical protein
MFNIESLNEMIIQTIPPITTAETDYFNTHQYLLKTYNNDTAAGQTIIVPLEKGEEGADGKAKVECEEPGLLFHEFVFLLGLIAVRYQHIENKDPPTEVLIEAFFKERLDFKEVPEDMKNIMKFDVLLKRAE